MATYTGRAARLRMHSVLSQHLISDFADNGAEVVAKLRKEKPVDYMKMVTAVLQQAGPAEVASATGYNVIERRVVRPENSDG